MERQKVFQFKKKQNLLIFKGFRKEKHEQNPQRLGIGTGVLKLHNTTSILKFFGLSIVSNYSIMLRVFLTH